LTPGTASAEVVLLLGPGPKVLDVKVIGEPEELKSAVDALKRVTIDQPFPDDAPTRLVRRGVLGCYPASGCSLVLIPPSMVRSAD
jgi:hypothetical protein